VGKRGGCSGAFYRWRGDGVTEAVEARSVVRRH
jgi:hypothetical protein